MKINIKTINMELTDAIRQYVEEKIGSLEKYIQRYDENDSIVASVEIGLPSTHHKKGEVYYAETNLNLPGQMLMASEQDYDLRTAVNRVKDKLQREINKYKTEKGHK